MQNTSISGSKNKGEKKMKKFEIAT